MPASYLAAACSRPTILTNLACAVAHEVGRAAVGAPFAVNAFAALIVALFIMRVIFLLLFFYIHFHAVYCGKLLGLYLTAGKIAQLYIYDLAYKV
jgi:hypothetical protein